jgi:hypothetical protein
MYEYQRNTDKQINSGGMYRAREEIVQGTVIAVSITPIEV